MITSITNSSFPQVIALTFMKDGSLSGSSYMRVGNVVASNAGFVLPSEGEIVAMTVAVQTAPTSAQTFQTRIRSGGTWANASGAILTLAANSRTASVVLPGIPVASAGELTMFYAGSATLSNAILTLYIRITV